MEKKGQIWVETVIYTLIGLSVIGLVLSAALPKINERKDAIAIEQSIDALRVIDNKMYQIQTAVGNRRVVDLDIKKGSLLIDSTRDEISWILESSFAYSEIGVPVSLGRLNVTTREEGVFEVELKMSYDFDIRFDNQTSGEKILNSAPTPYRFVMENAGVKGDGQAIINLVAN
ncbi:hypothetical protein HNV12_00705 [Methanococcoides sp. SA1]|nr:hypothetical protein [Methanococcoides sp. SA1]